jgi:hypothetical protein
VLESFVQSFFDLLHFRLIQASYFLFIYPFFTAVTRKGQQHC